MPWPFRSSRSRSQREHRDLPRSSRCEVYTSRESDRNYFSTQSHRPERSYEQSEREYYPSEREYYPPGYARTERSYETPERTYSSRSRRSHESPGLAYSFLGQPTEETVRLTRPSRDHFAGRTGFRYGEHVGEASYYSRDPYSSGGRRPSAFERRGPFADFDSVTRAGRAVDEEYRRRQCDAYESRLYGSSRSREGTAADVLGGPFASSQDRDPDGYARGFGEDGPYPRLGPPRARLAERRFFID